MPASPCHHEAVQRKIKDRFLGNYGQCLQFCNNFSGSPDFLLKEKGGRSMFSANQHTSTVCYFPGGLRPTQRS